MREHPPDRGPLSGDSHGDLAQPPNRREHGPHPCGNCTTAGCFSLLFAGAVDDGRLVATAHTATVTDEYAEIGVATLSQYRQQGIAAAAASLVCREVHALGRVPVWECGEGNEASRRLAMKLGFVYIGRRIDLIPVADA